VRRGYGQDAIRTLLGFAFGEMNLNRVSLHVLTDHTRAINTYRECGFVEEGRLREAVYAEGQYHDLLVMSILRQEFDDQRAARGE